MFFFFKQKTAYEMRISDWSSDVCSSDLARGWDRAIRLKTLADQFGTSAQQVNLMLRATEDVSTQMKSSITVEQRFREQMLVSGQSVDRLTSAQIGRAHV